MQYGDLDLNVQNLYLYMGTDPANDNATFGRDNSLRPFSSAVNQRDADLVYFWQKVTGGMYTNILLPWKQFILKSLILMNKLTYMLVSFPDEKYRKSAEGTSEKSEARKRLLEMMARRSHVDSSVELIGGLLFGSEEGSKVLNAVRPAGQALADDWDCLKSMVSRTLSMTHG